MNKRIRNRFEHYSENLENPSLHFCWRVLVERIQSHVICVTSAILFSIQVANSFNSFGLGPLRSNNPQPFTHSANITRLLSILWTRIPPSFPHEASESSDWSTSSCARI